MEIKQKFKYVDGSFDTDVCEMICVPHWKHREVELCIKTDNGWNVPVGQLKLYDSDLWVDADDTFEDAKKLGEEIARRWNTFREMKHEGQKALYIPDDRVVWVEKNTELNAFLWIDVDTGEGYYKKEIKLL